MTRKFVARGLLAGLLAAALVAVSTPAFAQIGTIKGRVVDDQGKPVPDAQLNFDYQGEQNLHFTGKTDSKGEWVRAGLMSVGRWSVTAKKGNLTGTLGDISVPLGSTATLPDIVIRSGGTAAGGDAAKGKQAELQKLFTEVNAAMTAGNYDVAITKLNEATTKDEKCAACYVHLGDAYVKKNDLDNAEKSYQKAIEVDDKSAEAYDGLASLYNQEKKFDDAAKASAKANELHGASAGGGDATSEFNTGVILWNQSKIADAKGHFQKALQLKPDMAEAHYYYGMCLVNEGKLPEAKASFEQYLKLAPTGPNAGMVKNILDTMK
jgi:tetratricopeptide (TPR) repeat protein